MMKTNKILYILRHGKAETGGAAQEDKDRALTPRGVEAAHIMGRYLATHHASPQHVLCSAAKRTCQTWEYANESFSLAKEQVEFSDKLYLASANETLNLLAAAPEAAHSLLLIGHNPGLHQLCLQLAKKGDENLLDDLMLKFPTCALAVISVPGSWKDIAHARGELLDFKTPHNLGGVED